jgi:ArsR family transcriptional regulator, arsenate/arsenite/antimonite-responsive transcriptional repressor
MMEPKMIDTEFLAMIRALADETRLLIIGMLASGQLCACDILESVPISQSTLSYHMRQLTDSHLVNSTRDGKWMHYALEHSALERLEGFIVQIATPGSVPFEKSASGCSSEGCDRTEEAEMSVKQTQEMST